MCKVSVGRSGGASNNALYITRENAVKDKEQGVLMRHMKEEIEGQNFAELRTNVSSYFWAREEVEIKTAPKNLIGKKNIDLSAREMVSEGVVKERKIRTNYRAILSFEREVETDKAKAMVNEWLSRTPFKNAPAIAALHRDTAHPHAHVLIDARRVDGKKVDLSPRQYRSLDEVWNKIYCREFGLDEQKHLAKKSEMREYKHAVVQAKQKGEPLPERPTRAPFPMREVFDKRDERISQTIAQDDVQHASGQFERNVKKVERRIKKQFTSQPTPDRQINVLAELGSRIEKLRQLEDTIRQRGRDLQHADEGRTIIRESKPQRGWGAFEKESRVSTGIARPETSTTKTIGGAAQRGEDREWASGGRSHAFTGTDESIPVTSGYEDSTVEIRADLKRAARVDATSFVSGTSARTGQSRHQSSPYLGDRESGKTQSRSNSSPQPTQELTPTAGEERHAVSSGSVEHSDALSDGSAEPAAEKIQGREPTRGQLYKLDAPGNLPPETGDALERGVGTHESRNSEVPKITESINVLDLRNDVPDLRDDSNAQRLDGAEEISGFADEMSDFDVTDRGLHSLRLESQTVPGFGETDGRIRQIAERARVDIYGNDALLPGNNLFDRPEPTITIVQREFDVSQQTTTDVCSMGNDDCLHYQRNMAEEPLQNDLLDADLKGRLVTSNSSLLEAVEQHTREANISLPETAELIEVEAEEVDAIEIGFDCLML